MNYPKDIISAVWPVVCFIKHKRCLNMGGDSFVFSMFIDLHKRPNVFSLSHQSHNVYGYVYINYIYKKMP